MKPSIAMKCIDQIPHPNAPAASASQPARFREGSVTARAVHRSPMAAPTHAMAYATTGFTHPY
ncbi:hypothetical protein GCM10010195_45420 [Kitasatospora griseola]|nr:hypothetical protein GCM10010195_45420 [Kitasatospora griseola]